MHLELVNKKYAGHIRAYLAAIQHTVGGVHGTGGNTLRIVFRNCWN